MLGKRAEITPTRKLEIELTTIVDHLKANIKEHKYLQAWRKDIEEKLSEARLKEEEAKTKDKTVDKQGELTLDME